MRSADQLHPAAAITGEPLFLDPARCKALLAATDAIVWTIHPTQGFVEPQSSWQAYTGQTWEQARGAGWLQVVHPTDRASVLRAWTDAVHRGDRYSAACRIWHEPSQAYRNCVVRATAIRDIDGNVEEWVGAVTDVHDRPLSLPEMHRLDEALQNQLQAHHKELERLFSVSVDVMLTLSGDGRLVTLSPSFETVTGYSEKNAVGELFEHFLHPDDVASTWKEVQRVLTGAHQAVDFETRIVRADGKVRLLSWRAVGSAAEGRLYAVGRDITEQHEEQQRSVRAQPMESVGRLTGGIAHDLTNVLAAVTSYIEVARKIAVKDPARLMTILDFALNSIRKGADLASRLLTFAKQQQPAQGRVDFNELVASMRDMIATTVGGAIALNIRLAPDLKPALADRTQLESVLLNVCINARDAMPQGGTLTIATAFHVITDDPGTQIDDLPKGRFILLSVEDTGVGMDEESLSRCREPFFATKRHGWGTGLGLPQALAVVQQLGGRLRVRSGPGVGTQVEVVLPEATAPLSTEYREGPKLQEPPPVEHATVLLVDDDEDVLGPAAQLLRTCGFEVVAARSAEEAMSLILSSQRFDVLLTDYAMPDKDGVELIRDAQQMRPRLVGVLASDTDIVQLQREMPQVTVLQKPFLPTRLVEAIGAAVTAHRLNTGER